MTTCYDVLPLPKPGETFRGSIVIASTVSVDRDTPLPGDLYRAPILDYGIMLLNPAEPYYTVAEVKAADGSGDWLWRVAVDTLSEATARYTDATGDK